MKHSFIFEKALLSAILISACPWTSFSEDFVLVRDNRPEAVIVQGAGYSPEIDRHVQFFNEELERCARTKLPVVKEADVDRNQIVFQVENRPLLQQDAFNIDFPDARTMRITGTKDSIRWALNHLLEQEIGIRWLFVPLKGFYGPEINHYPQMKDVTVKAESFSDQPAVPLSRMTDWKIAVFAPRWNAIRRNPYSHCMTIDVFPVYKYAEDGSWPEAIMPVINGKKLVLKKSKAPLPKNPWFAKEGYYNGWQPCWSNPETTRIAVENILEILKNNPDKKTVNMDVNDNGGCCECKACLKAVGGKVNMINYPDYSELYWGWVNKVAEEVTKQYPDVIFNGIAYCNVLNPPSFKLNSNILPQLCIELPTLLDPVWREKRLALIRDWSSKAARLDLFDYMHGLGRFLLPRIYFTSHSRILKDLIRNYNLRSAYFESDGQSAFQGPQQQLMVKILWNPDMDVEAFLQDWCEHAVGKKAAPYLRAYYQRWEDYWTGDEIKKTNWYSTIRNAYMQLGETNTHTYALKKGDLKEFRSLMEKVVELAETPEQKKRAQVLMQAYEISELAAITAFSEIIPPDGRLHSADEALELLQALPSAIDAAAKFQKHPLLLQFFKGKGKSMLASAAGSVGLVIPYMKDSRVRELIEKYVNDPTIPFTLRAQFKIWLGFKPENLIDNGSFEQDRSVMICQTSAGGSRDDRHASDGKYSFRTGNDEYVMNVKMEPGKNYLFLCDVYIEKGSGEGRFSYRLGPSIGNVPRNWFNASDLIPSGGVWNTYSTVVSHPRRESKNIDTLRIEMWLRNFEKDEPVWIDNIRLYCLDDLIQSESSRK